MREASALALVALPLGRRIGRQSSGQQRPVAGEQRVVQLGWYPPPALCPCFLGCRAHCTQHPVELPCPCVLVLLLQEGPFPQVMNIAERMTAGGVAAVAGPAVVHTHAVEVGQDADGVDGCASAFGMDGMDGMDGIVREARGTGHMRPGQPPAPAPAPAPAGFVVVPPRRTPQRRCDRGFHWCHAVGDLLDPAHHRATPQPDPAQVAEHLLGAATGNERCLHQIHGQGPQAWAVLRAARHLGGKRPGRDRVAARAAHVQRTCSA